MPNGLRDQFDLVKLGAENVSSIETRPTVHNCLLSNDLFLFLSFSFQDKALAKMSSVMMHHLIGVTMNYPQTLYFSIWTKTRDDIVRTNVYTSINKT